MQHSPNPFAQYPLAEPPLPEHSRAVIQVPLSPDAPAHPPFGNVTTVNKDKTVTNVCISEHITQMTFFLFRYVFYST